MGAEAFVAAQIVDFAEATDDRVASLIVAGSGISIAYNDGAGTLTIASTVLASFASLSGSPSDNAALAAALDSKQPLDSDLTAIAALSTTAFGRALLTQADAAATRATIGAGTSSFDGTFAALTGKPTTISGYGITDAQPLDSDLTAIAALATTSFGRSLLTQADAAATRSTIGAGTGNIGGSTGSTDNAVLRADGTGGTTTQDSSFVIADLATASPNNTVNHASFQAVGATTNVSSSFVPKGSGAFSLAVPDGTSTGGNARGANAVDLSIGSRSGADYVASGARAVVLGRGRASGQDSFATGNCTASQEFAACFGDGGTANTASGRRSFVAGGRFSSASGDDSFSAGQSINASGPSSAGIGSDNTASAFASFATGQHANADRHAMRAHAAGCFAARGDAQKATFVLRQKTTTATPVNLALDGSSTRLVVNTGEILSFVAHITGSKSDGTAIASFIRRGVIKRISNTTSLVGSIQTIGTDIEDNASTDVAITADDTNEALQIAVTGIAGETWRWVAVVEAVDLAFGT